MLDKYCIILRGRSPTTSIPTTAQNGLCMGQVSQEHTRTTLPWQLHYIPVDTASPKTEGCPKLPLFHHSECREIHWLWNAAVQPCTTVQGHLNACIRILGRMHCLYMYMSCAVRTLIKALHPYRALLLCTKVTFFIEPFPAQAQCSQAPLITLASSWSSGSRRSTISL